MPNPWYLSLTSIVQSMDYKTELKALQKNAVKHHDSCLRFHAFCILSAGLEYIKNYVSHPKTAIVNNCVCTWNATYKHNKNGSIVIYSTITGSFDCERFLRKAKPCAKLANHSVYVIKEIYFDI